MKKTPQHKIDQILELVNQGITNMGISEKTGISYHTVKTIIHKNIGPRNKRRNKDLDKLYSDIANDRLTMTLQEVAAKYGKTTRYIDHTTCRHPLRPQFKSNRPPRKVKKHSDIKRKKDINSIDHSRMEKGEVKLKKNERVFENRTFDKSLQRAVSLNDSKKTVVFVKSSDTRSDEEIRSFFRERNDKEIKELSSNPMNGNPSVSNRKNNRMVSL
ncbi:hypothetical protein [Sphingobacterium griseoflavum]|uniref:Transposase IS30-like HTH domain-containing protein n=1 Tax=Sphingobacterium griseoflavum TaxID=1474952 RepID=A0ABQ3HWN1_9SPHI|nr:hypothetical protein [Sphingobacterium griseoflavum]GHE35069.1 hypothetical protein GCM10017764_17860 [Sphingobacterium griseoflavum]